VDNFKASRKNSAKLLFSISQAFIDRAVGFGLIALAAIIFVYYTTWVFITVRRIFSATQIMLRIAVRAFFGCIREKFQALVYLV